MDLNILWHIEGIIAALLTAFGFVPQIIKMYKSKSSQDISLGSLLQFGAGTGLWTVYGVHIRDLIVVMANMISFLIIVATIIMYLNYK